MPNWKTSASVPSEVNVELRDHASSSADRRASSRIRTRQGRRRKARERKSLTSRARTTSSRARGAWSDSHAVANMIEGVTKGFRKSLEIQGVGYRVDKAGSDLNFSLGYSHPIVIQGAEGIAFAVEGTTKSARRRDRQAASRPSRCRRSASCVRRSPTRAKACDTKAKIVRKKLGKAGKAREEVMREYRAPSSASSATAAFAKRLSARKRARACRSSAACTTPTRSSSTMRRATPSSPARRARGALPRPRSRGPNSKPPKGRQEIAEARQGQGITTVVFDTAAEVSRPRGRARRSRP